jgi:hypothetical protein
MPGVVPDLQDRLVRRSGVLEGRDRVARVPDLAAGAVLEPALPVALGQGQRFRCHAADPNQRQPPFPLELNPASTPRLTKVTLPETAPALPTPLLSPRYRWATIGMVSLIFLAAFEALAVTTIMPTVSADLDGRAWFSAAFSVTLAASVVGMVAGGMWADRSGPNLPLLASVGGFSLGLLLAGWRRRSSCSWRRGSCRDWAWAR